jgi:hypothetical protein
MIVFLKSISGLRRPPSSPCRRPGRRSRARRVGLLDLVEQHHAVGLAAHGLGQHAALAVADVAGGRALQRGDGVRLLVLAHVDGDDVLLAAVERLGQRQRGLGLADARRAGQHEHADRLVGVVELGARLVWMRLRSSPCRGPGRSRACRACSAGCSTVSISSADHAADRDAGPVGDHRGDGLVIDRRQDQRCLALQRRRVGLQPPPAPSNAPRSARPSAAGFGGAVRRDGARRPGFELAAGAFDRLPRTAQLRRARPGPSSTRPSPASQRASSGQRDAPLDEPSFACGASRRSPIVPDRLLAPMISSSVCRASMRAAAIVHLGRRRAG